MEWIEIRSHLLGTVSHNPFFLLSDMEPKLSTLKPHSQPKGWSLFIYSFAYVSSRIQIFQLHYNSPYHPGTKHMARSHRVFPNEWIVGSILNTIKSTCVCVKQRPVGWGSPVDTEAGRKPSVTGSTFIPSRAVHSKVLAGWHCIESYSHKLSYGD